ncbi:MAG: hypothetical protein ABI867_28020 [Kofleriaceae bacterium]
MSSLGQVIRVGVVAASVLVAIASSGRQPSTHAVKSTTTFPSSYDATWTALIDVFAERGWQIATLEKTSGLITTNWMELKDEAKLYADCGSPPLASVPRIQIRFNVRLKEAAGGASVSVNSFFRRFDSNTDTDPPIDCESTGAVEKLVHADISRRAGSAAPSPKPPVVAAAPVEAPRGFFCTSSPTQAKVSTCTRQKDRCTSARDALVAAVADVTACALVETAWCFAGERCSSSEAACSSQLAAASATGACVETK